MLFIFLAATTLFLARINASGARNNVDQVTTSALAQAKEALIGRAASNINRPGSLPCPDTNDNGTAPLFVGAGNQCPSYLGRLPWKTLDLPEPLDGNGDTLWYAFSPGLRDSSVAQPINSVKTLELTFDNAPNVAAIIFSPGSPLESQSGRRSVDVADYLDGSNKDGNSNYVSGPPSANFNDKALVITREELFRTVNQRVLADVRGSDMAPLPLSEGLRYYHIIHGFFPWADTDGDGIENVGETDGTLPFNALNLKGWLNSNGWLQLIAYKRINAGLISIAIAGSSKTLDVIPCPSSPCP